LIQYTSKNLTFKGSPERLTRCQRKETTIGASKASAYLLLLCKYLTWNLAIARFFFIWSP